MDNLSKDQWKGEFMPQPNPNSKPDYEPEIIKCGDCYAHYPIGNLHICDPLIKALVTRKRERDNNDMAV